MAWVLWALADGSTYPTVGGAKTVVTAILHQGLTLGWHWPLLGWSCWLTDQEADCGCTFQLGLSPSRPKSSDLCFIKSSKNPSQKILSLPLTLRAPSLSFSSCPSLFLSSLIFHLVLSLVLYHFLRGMGIDRIFCVFIDSKKVFFSRQVLNKYESMTWGIWNGDMH